ncbi:hypothetical protein BDN71DRAFT_1510165 [Pleurotus eryngii]|uniref:Uncharacterized protein n=1 Tax=Pleurotus eryngii TaxID=5323 RepID=A0A9P6DDB7_PLEER|nr:hypothetical protein BDN71DRAFT_1510165 [Pleurotus eryngii]
MKPNSNQGREGDESTSEIRLGGSSPPVPHPPSRPLLALRSGAVIKNSYDRRLEYQKRTFGWLNAWLAMYHVRHCHPREFATKVATKELSRGVMSRLQSSLKSYWSAGLEHMLGRTPYDVVKGIGVNDVGPTLSRTPSAPQSHHSTANETHLRARFAIIPVVPPHSRHGRAPLSSLPMAVAFNQLTSLGESGIPTPDWFSLPLRYICLLVTSFDLPHPVTIVVALASQR